MSENVDPPSVRSDGGPPFAPVDDGYTAEVISERTRSRFTLKQKIVRVFWLAGWTFLFRPSFHNWYAWRRFVLRMFGGRVGKGVILRASVWIEIPWNVDLGDDSTVGDCAILYSLAPITLGRHAVVSQYAHLCTGTHDHTLRSFPMICKPIRIEDEAWVAADAFVGPGVTIGARSLVGARSTVMKDVPPDVIVAGNPPRVIGPRVIRG